MKRTRKLPVHRLRRRPPFFHPVPLRSRRDGWTVVRQCHFLAQLYLTGSVREAARRVGMSRASAYRLRARAGAEGFAAARDHVLAPPSAERAGRPRLPRQDRRKVTLAALVQQAGGGLVRPLLHRAAIVGIEKKPDNSALLTVLGRSLAQRARRVQAAAVRTERNCENAAFGVTRLAEVYQLSPRFAHGNGTTRTAGLTAPAECGPSRQTASRGIA